jgi:pimeloyl-ACP methyl ester carboxylesterase
VTRFLPTAERLARFGMNVVGMRSQWMTLRGLRVHLYDGRGAGSLPTTVMLHGLGAAGSSFARLVGRVRPHVRRVIVPELPGHGFTDHPGDRPVTPELVLDVVTPMLDQLLDEPAVLYGNSLGGAVAIQYALRRPERVRALVLVSPAGARLPAEEWAKIITAFDVSDTREARRFLERVYHRPPWFLAFLAHEFPDIINRRAVRELLASARQDHGAGPDELASLRMPVLLVWGRSEKLLPAQALEYFRTHLPPHAVVEQPSAFGHAPQIEHPRLVADRVLAFARSVHAAKAAVAL